MYIVYLYIGSSSISVTICICVYVFTNIYLSIYLYIYITIYDINTQPSNTHLLYSIYRNTVDKYGTGAGIKEEARLSVLREKLIADMEHKGVNPKYLGEMKGVDIRKMLNR